MMSDNPAPSPYRTALAAMRPGLVIAGGFSAVISVLMLTGSIYMLQVYDRVLSSGSVPTLLGLFAIVIVLYGFLAVYDFLRVRLLARLSLRLDLGLGPTAFGAMIRTAVPGRVGPAEAAGGQPLRDLETLRGFLSGPAVTALFDLPWVPLYVAVLFAIHPLFGVLTLAGAGVAAALALANRAVMQAPLQKTLAEDAKSRDFADKSCRNAETVLAMGMQASITARWHRLHRAVLIAGQRGSDPSEVLAAASRAFRMLLQSAMLTLGAWLVLAGEISGGMIIASSILSGRALAPVDQLISQWRSIGRTIEAHHRLTRFFAQAGAEKPRIDLPAPTGKIAVSGLTKFVPQRSGSQPGTDRARILDGVSFTLEPGDGLGVIGTSASGKSSLARLLVGAWDADAGEIRLDGATPDQWNPVILGRHIGYLPQVVDLIPGSLRDNIARFDTAILDAEVIAAAELAGVHEMILRLPDGYATEVGRAGEPLPLSGGQVQRLGLARAICGQPRLVVLDEPNSNLDVAGDAALTRTISTLRAAGSVVIVMAHRPSAIAAVNKLMVLQGGRLVQFGDKESVLVAASQPAAANRPDATSAPLSARSGTVVDLAPPVSGDAAPAEAAAVESGSELPDAMAVRLPRRAGAKHLLPGSTLFRQAGQERAHP